MVMNKNGAKKRHPSLYVFMDDGLLSREDTIYATKRHLSIIWISHIARKCLITSGVCIFQVFPLAYVLRNY